MARDTATVEVAREAFRRWRGLALFLLLLAAQGCGGSDGHAGPTGTPPPADLVGQWRTTLGYIPAFFTGAAGNTDVIGSMGISFYFAPGGSYRFELDTASTSEFCVRTTSWTETGVVSIAGSEITFTSTHAIDSVLDSCGQAKYVDPAPTGTATWTMALEQDQAGAPVLRMRPPKGEDVLLRR